MKIAFIDRSGERVSIGLKFDFSVETLIFVKSIPQRKYDPKNKQWNIPLLLENCVKIKEHEFLFHKALREWANKSYSRIHKFSREIPGLKGTLMPFQSIGVKEIERFNGRVILADEMGLGKTVQALAWLQLRIELRPVLIICPASLKLNWKKECEKWMENPQVVVLSGTTPDPTQMTQINIINYDILSYWKAVFRTIPFEVVILDEFHYIKDRGTKQKPVIRTRSTMEVCRNIPYVIGLTGTPIENSPKELFNPLKIINPILFPSEFLFKKRYCNPKHNGFGWTYNGATNVEELHEILKKQCLIRRLKKDVLTDLPEKSFNVVLMEINNRDEYFKIENEFIQYLENKVIIQARRAFGEFIQNEGDFVTFDDHKLERMVEDQLEKANPMVQMEMLKQKAVEGKLKSSMEWIDDFLLSGEKLILFATHKNIIHALKTKYKKISVTVDGSTPMKKRQENVELFQSSKKIKLFIGNIKAAGVGLTLTAASNVAFMEYPWTPGQLSQAIDRAHRIGQKNAVMVHFLIANQTIEEKLINIIQSKQIIADSIIDGKSMENTVLMDELIKKYLS